MIEKSNDPHQRKELTKSRISRDWITKFGNNNNDSVGDIL